MRTRKDTENEEFELFQHNHVKLIQTNLSRLEKNKSLQKISQDPKEFLYLLAALLKRGIPFSTLYVKASCYLAGFARGIMPNDPDPERVEKEHERAQRRKQLLDQVPFIPLIAHAVCSYAELPHWFNFQQIKEPDNDFYKIINRMQLYNKIKYEYYGDSWKQAGRKQGVKQLRDEILDILLVQAKQDEQLCSDIQALRNSRLSFKKLGACVECADAKKIHKMILRLNDRVIEKIDSSKAENNRIDRQPLKPLSTSPLLFGGKKQTVSLGPVELAHARFNKLSQ